MFLMTCVHDYFKTTCFTYVEKLALKKMDDFSVADLEINDPRIEFIAEFSLVSWYLEIRARRI